MNWTMKSRMFEKQFVCEIGWLCYSEFYRDIIQRHPYVYNFSSLPHRQRRDVQIKWKSFSYLSLWLLNKAAARQAGWHACQPANFQAVSGRDGRRPATACHVIIINASRNWKLWLENVIMNSQVWKITIFVAVSREREWWHTQWSLDLLKARKSVFTAKFPRIFSSNSPRKGRAAYSVSFFLTSLFSHLPPSSYQLLTKNAHWCYFFV